MLKLATGTNNYHLHKAVVGFIRKETKRVKTKEKLGIGGLKLNSKDYPTLMVQRFLKDGDTEARNSLPVFYSAHKNHLTSSPKTSSPL